MGVSVESAGVLALAGYLDGRLSAAFGAEVAKCQASFPEGDQPLFDGVTRQKVTILCAGKREDTHVTADIVKSEAVDALSGRYWWRMKACRQPLQIDLWAASEAKRDALIAEIDIAFHQGTLVTLGDATGDPVSDGILLRLLPENGHEGFASFCFDGPELIHDGESHRRREYRAMVTGYVDVDLAVVAVSARIAQIFFQATLNKARSTYSYQPTGSPPQFELTGSTEG